MRDRSGNAFSCDLQEISQKTPLTQIVFTMKIV